MRLGLLGGSFDPIHNGHMTLARAAAAAGGLDRVVLMPARRAPHKHRPDMADPWHRFAMAALAASGEPGILVSALELSREGPSYTIDTVRHLIEAGHDVTLVIGSDSLAELDSWRECRDLLDLTRLLVYQRSPHLRASLEPSLAGWIRARGEAGAIEWLAGPVDETSSSGIRERLRSGREVAGQVPDAVLGHIRRHGLYTTQGLI